MSGPEGETFKFARAMRQFHEAATRGHEDRAIDALADALDVKAETLGKRAGPAIAEAIRARQILSKLTQDEYDALAKHVGPGAIEQLEDWDTTLEAWAQAMHPKRHH